MKFDIAKCGMCGNAFVGLMGARNVCNNCRDEEQKLYHKLRTLIRDNPDKRFSIQEAAQLLRVDEKKIAHLVDSGLVQLVQNRKYLNLFD